MSFKLKISSTTPVCINIAFSNGVAQTEVSALLFSSSSRSFDLLGEESGVGRRDRYYHDLLHDGSWKNKY